MKKAIFFWVGVCSCLTALCQQYSSAEVFAHNDYVHPIPFYSSYALQPGYIEADIFLQKGDLLVAHTLKEINPENTLDELYLKPLQKMIRKNKGSAYADTKRELTLMIDLKTEGTATLNVLVKKLKAYPDLLACRTLHFAVSGSMPDPSQWKQFPDFILFDGRPEKKYTKEQLARVHLVSTDFKKYSKWEGKGDASQEELKNIRALIDSVHAVGKKLRFWGTPDKLSVWMTLMDLRVDILGTDNVEGLLGFIRSRSKNTYRQNIAYTTYKPQHDQFAGKPKNIILMIGDGMGLAQIYSGYTANRGSLNLFNLKDIGFSITRSSDSYITDSAAGATAMATGTKTNNGFDSVDSLGRPLPSITEKLKPLGYNVAIISNGEITDATPACFYAHDNSRHHNEEIAEDFLNSNVDILVGSKTEYFTKRKDGKNLFDLISRKGYVVSDKLSAMDTIRSKRFVIVDDAAGLSIREGRTDFLQRTLRKSLTAFTKDGKPFFIMEEGGQIDHGGHENDVAYIVTEMLDFDKAVGDAMKFVDENPETLLIITADHETGGLSLIGGSVRQGEVIGDFSTNGHSAIAVPVFAYGPGSSLFRGVYQNTAIYHKIIEALKLK